MDGDVQRVHEVGIEEGADGLRSAAEPDVVALRGFPGHGEHRGRLLVDEVERGVREGERGPEVVGEHEDRVWNGGSSPHQPSHS